MTLPELIAERDRNRELVAQFMIAHSIATGHGDTIEDLLKELGAEVTELQRASRNRDMWKGQVERQAAILLNLRPLFLDALASLDHAADALDDLANGRGLTCPIENIVRGTRATSDKIREGLSDGE